MGNPEWVRHCLEDGVSSLVVETNSAVACNLVENKSKSNVLLQPLLRKIFQLMDREWDVLVQHVYREANMCADWLANKACTLPLGVHICEEPPGGNGEYLLVSLPRLTIFQFVLG